MTEQQAYDELRCYTLGLHDASFIHQHVVDAFTAQRADETTKAIALTFALVGLYLYIEKGISGREIQQVHMDLARQKRVWPTFPLPQERGLISATDIMAAPEGALREQAIHAWCTTVWEAFRESHQAVAGLVLQRRVKR